MKIYSRKLLKAILLTLLGMAVIILASRETGLLQNRFQLKADFENIGGLKLNSNVVIKGEIVGEVSDIIYNHDGYMVRVSMTFAQQPDLPVDTTASVLQSGLLTEQYIELDPGLDQAYLGSGDLIKLTQPALAFEQVSGQRLQTREREEFIGEKSL